MYFLFLDFSIFISMEDLPENVTGASSLKIVFIIIAIIIRQDEVNPVFRLATRAGKMGLSCPQWEIMPALFPQKQKQKQKQKKL